MDDLIAFFSEMECYPDPVMQERIKMAISALEALQAEKAALEKWHEVAAVELNDAHARIWQLEAELAGARKRDAEIYSLLRRIRTWGITSSGYDGSECIENTADVDAMMRRLNEAKRAADAIEQGAHHADH